MGRIDPSDKNFRLTDDEYAEEIYKLYGKLMMSAASSVLKNKADAEDALQDALICAMKYRHKNDDVRTERFRSFICIIARNKAIDIYRKRNRLNEVELDELEKTEYPSRSEGNDAFETALLVLPELDRDILFLRYDNGFTTREIGRMLGMKQDTVQKNIKRSKRLLGELLNGQNTGK